MEFYEEYVPIGKTLQYFLHCPVPETDTVLLYLHGGPGFSAAYRAWSAGFLFSPPNPFKKADGDSVFFNIGMDFIPKSILL